METKVRVQMGDALANLGRRLGLTDEDFAVIEQARYTAPFEAAGIATVVPGL
ncbi:MAG: hypothetical protein LBK91_05845 [Synergistaceae bacterium]|jgi:hypothetical protein|nr:hypothetical protein [Synergistaceae bacterium]